jgi:hypothetical protein
MPRPLTLSFKLLLLISRKRIFQTLLLVPRLSTPLFKDFNKTLLIAKVSKLTQKDLVNGFLFSRIQRPLLKPSLKILLVT